jgi:hypothetical protein
MGSERDLCQFTEHWSCGACGGPVFRRKPHVHAYYRAPGSASVLCEECWSVILCSSTIILQALTQAGIEATSGELKRMVDEGAIAAIVPQPLFLN